MVYHPRLMLRAAALFLLSSTILVPGLKHERYALAQDDVRSVQQQQQEPQQRVAVLTSGTLIRYFLNSTAERLISPMVRQGHKVDYFLALNVEPFKPWRNDSDSFLPDPALEAEPAVVRELVNESIKRVGGRLRRFDLLSEVALDTAEEREFLTSASMQKSHRVVEERRISARSSILKYTKTLEGLWHEVEKVENQTGHRYTYVIIIRDDAFWLEDFDLNRLLQYSTPDYRGRELHRGYNLLCTESKRKMPHARQKMFDPSDQKEFVEYVFVLERGAAKPYATQYSHIVNEPDHRYWQAKNIERMSAMLAEENSIKMEHVPARLIPFQRSGRIRGPDGNATVVCLHKVCDSSSREVAPLRPKSSFEVCDRLTWMKPAGAAGDR